jgi:hypothetical protein
LFLGVAVVAVQAVPFGLAAGAVVPKELEGTLVLIGVVGIQLAMKASSPVSKALPFYGPHRLIESSLTHEGPIAGPLAQTALYGLGMLIVARVFIARRVSVTRHANIVEKARQ